MIILFLSCGSIVVGQLYSALRLVQKSGEISNHKTVSQLVQ